MGSADCTEDGEISLLLHCSYQCHVKQQYDQLAMCESTDRCGVKRLEKMKIGFFITAEYITQ
jgi:hypothetical protein